MKIKRGKVWLANLDPSKGSEQAEIRPIIVFQESNLSKFTTTIITIPLTKNLRRATLPTCLQIVKGQDGLDQDSVSVINSAYLIKLD
jgi:mRNA interferase MazF